jgi:hypothetical protein
MHMNSSVTLEVSLLFVLEWFTFWTPLFYFQHIVYIVISLEVDAEINKRVRGSLMLNGTKNIEWMGGRIHADFALFPSIFNKLELWIIEPEAAIEDFASNNDGPF